MQDRWVNNNGLGMDVFTPTRWVSNLFTSVLVLVTLVYIALYALNGMTLLIVCSLICLAMLAVSFFLIARGPDVRYMAVNYVEIAFFMMANVSLLGIDYGFQLYCFGFVASAMFLNLTAGDGNKVLWQSQLLIALSVTYYLATTLWFGLYEPLYSFENPLVASVAHVLNAASTFGAIVLFTSVYMITAVNLGQRLSIAASHDDLTQLPNRRGFYPVIEEAFEANAGRAGSCYFAMLDIDHFKGINDRFGHKCGDAVLRSIAEVLSDCSQRWPGLKASRWGGEEFLIVYVPQDEGASGTGAVAAKEVFEELRTSIGAASVEMDGNVIRCTATIGVADSAEGATAEEAINLADERLYEGKQAGRNRVVLGSQD